MQVETATSEIITAWEELAREVEPLFEDRMAGDKDFREFMIRKIAQRDTFIVRDREKYDKLLGLIAVSHNINAISWFAVSEKNRGKGVGYLLLSHAIEDMDKTREISVITFTEDNKEGLSARRLYRKFGFKDFDNNYIHNGHRRCIMKRPPQTK
jgi:ribosomal protein S18 acetylase RimI-like enzyme